MNNIFGNNPKQEKLQIQTGEEERFYIYRLMEQYFSSME